MSVTDEGFDFGELKKLSSVEDVEDIREALNQVIGHIFDILARLTGSVMVDRMLNEVDVPKTVNLPSPYGSERAA